MKKRIIFACSSGIATSTLVAEKTREYCKNNGIDIETQQSTVGEIPQLDDSADLFVVTSEIGTDLNTPVVNALPIVTGVGEKEVLEEIASILRG